VAAPQGQLQGSCREAGTFTTPGACNWSSDSGGGTKGAGGGDAAGAGADTGTLACGLGAAGAGLLASGSGETPTGGRTSGGNPSGNTPAGWVLRKLMSPSLATLANTGVGKPPGGWPSSEGCGEPLGTAASGL